jgi:hypothetical protein
MRILAAATFFALALSLPAGAPAQQRPILSPRDSVSLALDTNTITVNYGRPSMRGRTIMGGLVPWEKVWRTGANQATHLRTSFDLLMGGVPVPRGTYTLWTIPRPTGWTIILNKQTGQWGTLYDPRQDLARFDVGASAAEAVVDTFTISLLGAGRTGGLLRLAWERTMVSIPFEKNDRIRPISPADSVETSLRRTKVAISYSRPYARGRTVWGVVVPFDSVWRTGANRTTTLMTTGEIRIGSAKIPAGAYTIYSVPSEEGFTLIISRKPAGFPAYDSTMDLVRIPMTRVKGSAPVDPFRIWFQKGQSGMQLCLGWADRTYSVPLSAK